MNLLFIGTTELIIIVLIIVLLFGAKKIPELMRGLGKGVKEFKAGQEEDNESKTNTDKQPDEKKD